ncbi:MAG TPA: amidohydrolase [Methanocella sp.]|nr:amidohydrolase [Methanocella sp.]
MSKATNTVQPVIVFTNGRIITMDPMRGRAEAIVVEDGHITAVGDGSIAKAYGDAEIVDLQGRTLLPAFIDPHNHLSFGCFTPGWAKLDGLPNRTAVLGAIQEHAKVHPDKGWIIGFPWIDAETGGVTLTRADLDEACPDRPVLLIHGTFHKAVANSEALRLAGVDRYYHNTRNGKALRDVTGEPTGVLLETAMAPAFKLAMAPTTAEYADLIEARAREFLAYGITAVGDPGVTSAAEEAYRYLHSRSRLPVSVLMMPHGETLLDNQLGSRLDGPVTGTGDTLLRVGPVKLFADGGVQSTAAFAGVIMGTRQTLGLPRDDFEAELIRATERRFRVCAHSLGNGSTEALITAFEKAAQRAPAGFELRPRIDHLFLTSEEQIRRFAALGGCAAVQPHFVTRSARLIQVPFEGFQWFAFDTMAKEGMVVATGSDNPCFGSDFAIQPLKCAALGASLSGGPGNVLVAEDASPFEQWLWMYTAGAAYVSGLEHERGMLKPGMVADLVVLDGVFEPKNPPAVAETWKAGARVYQRQTK